ncbi:hypothetical protein BB559_001357, partial [Furculomyces boomerangus]
MKPKNLQKTKPKHKDALVPKAYAFISTVFLSNKYFNYGLCALVIFEFMFNFLIIKKVAYTEIDWKAYMQQVDIYLNGERNYNNIYGDTGPLVYPAGFVWIYTLMYYITERGQNILRAQYIFMGLYIVTLITVAKIYRMDKKVSLVYVLMLSVSKRLHSIYVLRLFNDPFAFFFALLGTLYLAKRKIVVSSILFSLGISIKMNVLLWIPGVMFCIFVMGGIQSVLISILVIVGIQIIVGLPFLLTFPKEYLVKSFEFGREFMFKWTVNWRMIGKDIFLSQEFSKMLLAIHLLLLLFAVILWSRPYNGIFKVIKNGIFGTKNKKMLQS